MKKIRVLVVDDSAFMRKVISDMLNEDESIEVVDTARDGIGAIERLKNLDIDVITMDVEMPQMNGLEALKKINELYKKPVIMLSSLTREGADITINALESGAFDFVLKPSRGAGFNIEELKNELTYKIKLCCQKQGRCSEKTSDEIAAASERKTPRLKDTDIKAVCMAASTGGPKALAAALSLLPESFKLPVMVVQHMPPGFTKAFADRLNGICSLNVKEAVHGDRIEKGNVYIAPGGYHMVVGVDGCIALNQEPTLHGVRPSADKLFISAAENMGGKLIGVVLTGMGRDGTSGLEAIKNKGGICIAEDESTCTIFGMPKSAIEKGAVHIVAPLQDVVKEILNIIGD